MLASGGGSQLPLAPSENIWNFPLFVDFCFFSDVFRSGFVSIRSLGGFFGLTLFRALSVSRFFVSIRTNFNTKNFVNHGQSFYEQKKGRVQRL